MAFEVKFQVVKSPMILMFSRMGFDFQSPSDSGNAFFSGRLDKEESDGLERLRDKKLTLIRHFWNSRSFFLASG